MVTQGKTKGMAVMFAVTFVIIACVFVVSVIKTDKYNEKVYSDSFYGDRLFAEEATYNGDVSIRIVKRNGTWQKLIDPEKRGLTQPDFQAYTYDFCISNDTDDDVRDYDFKFTFDRETYLMSAWNGALEIHQLRDGGEYVATVPDLRQFEPDLYDFDMRTPDGDSLIRMRKGDFIIYHPSTAEISLEVPVKPHEGIVSGIIMYVPVGEDLKDVVLDLDYSFDRELQSEPLFKISICFLVIWFIAIIVFIVTEAKIRKYASRHERDNEIVKESIETFTGFIDAKDPYTNGHSNRVAEYTRMIAREMGYDGEALDRIYYVALLHDCGKIGVPDNILRKPGKLTPEEFEVIKSHTVRGGEILSSFKSLTDVDQGARYHHERYDGKGYPEGRKGEDIPLIARMICVADSFDAMNSNRVYRKKLTREDIIDELTKNSGTQFDPKIAEIFLKLIRSGKVEIK